MIPLRLDEPDYAKLADATSQTLNRYGNPIQLLPDGDQGVSLHINGDAGIGDNPNRTRQHAFHFTADNCIGCHACEAACSEKNDLPAHLSFRSVGYVEGGSYPDYTRINISMACNHCDDPVCLKGCPTRAYTKHPEYGAVIQDPDICFGCGYCTWVCPYNAPQLDPMAGQVEKCNMCVDRLEVGLKPACVSACVGNALDFGVVENVPRTTRAGGHPHPGISGSDDHQGEHPVPANQSDAARGRTPRFGTGEVPAEPSAGELEGLVPRKSEHRVRVPSRCRSQGRGRTAVESRAAFVAREPARGVHAGGAGRGRRVRDVVRRRAGKCLGRGGRAGPRRPWHGRVHGPPSARPCASIAASTTCGTRA